MSDQESLLDVHKTRARSNRRLIQAMFSIVVICLGLSISRYSQIREDLDWNAKDLLFDYSVKYGPLVIEKLGLKPDSTNSINITFQMAETDSSTSSTTIWSSSQVPNLQAYLKSHLLSYRNEQTGFLGYSMVAQGIPAMAMIASFIILLVIWRNVWVMQAIKRHESVGLPQSVFAQSIMDSILFELAPKKTHRSWGMQVSLCIAILLVLSAAVTICSTCVMQMPPLEATLHLNPLSLPEVGYFEVFEGLPGPYTFTFPMDTRPVENAVFLMLFHISAIAGIAATLLLGNRRSSRSKGTALEQPASQSATSNNSNSPDNQADTAEFCKQDATLSIPERCSNQSIELGIDRPLTRHASMVVESVLVLYGRTVAFLIISFLFGLFISWMGWQASVESGYSLAAYGLAFLFLFAIFGLMFELVDQKLACTIGALIGALTYFDAFILRERATALDALIFQFPGWLIWLSLAALVSAIWFAVTHHY